MRVLIVDDAYHTRKLIVEALEKKNTLEFEVAKNGEEAIEKAKAFSPSITILDLGLKGSPNSISLIKQLREHTNTRFIVLTADPSPLKKEAEDLDVDIFLPKPFQASYLLKRIDILEEKIKQEPNEKQTLDAIVLEIHPEQKNKVLSIEKKEDKMFVLPEDFQETQQKFQLNKQNISQIIEETQHLIEEEETEDWFSSATTKNKTSKSNPIVIEKETEVTAKKDVERNNETETITVQPKKMIKEKTLTHNEYVQDDEQEQVMFPHHYSSTQEKVLKKENEKDGIKMSPLTSISKEKEMEHSFGINKKEPSTMSMQDEKKAKTSHLLSEKKPTIRAPRKIFRKEETVSTTTSSYPEKLGESLVIEIDPDTKTHVVSAKDEKRNSFLSFLTKLFKK